MSDFFQDYVWKNGIPYGIRKILDENFELETYKIVMDPYRKRISIEKYSGKQFLCVVYDSVLLDFRHLKKLDQERWEKRVISEAADEMICEIRNQDDRLLFVERYKFELEVCRECVVHSPHGILLSKHEMFYTKLGDTFNGVKLFDANGHEVMSKSYSISEESSEFGELLAEKWE